MQWFVVCLTFTFDNGHLVGYIASAVWAGIYPSIMPYLAFKEVSKRYKYLLAILPELRYHPV